MKYLSMIISVLVLITCNSSQHEEECCFNTDRAFRKKNRITLSDFDDSKQLKFACKEPIEMTILQLIPNKPIIFDDSFKIKKLKIKVKSEEEEVLSVVLTNFKGFDLNSNPFKDVIINENSKVYYFQIDSNFDFYLNKTLINKNNCNEHLPNLSITRQAKVLILEKANTNSDKTCPLVFANANIIMFSVKMKLSLINKNSLSFHNVSVIDLNCTIFQTILSVYRSDLNEQVLNKHVFMNLKILDIYGVINGIDVNSFKNLKQLHMLKLKSQYVKNIFVKNNKWLQYLNQDVISQNLSRHDENNMFTLVVYQSIENVTYYDYPDEDFCLFNDFPHQRLVVPVLRPSSKSTCSCTELFLIQYANKYSDFIQNLEKYFIVANYYMYEYRIYSEKKLHVCLNASLNDMLKKCNFKQRLAKCKIKTVEANQNLDIYIYDFMEISGLIELIFVKYYVNVIFLIVSVLVNTLMIIILSLKSFKKSYMYIYLKIHSLFNLVFCLTTILGYILGDCSVDDVFCSKKYESIALHYVKIILIKMIGNSAKTCSNIAHVSFCLSRYKKMKGSEYLFIKSLNNLSIRTYLILMIILSILLNLYRNFEFSTQISSNLSGFYRLSNFFNQDSFYDYKENFTNYEYIILNIFQYINIFFSDLTYILSTTIIDILLFKIVKGQMAAKRLILSTRPALVNTNEILSAEQRISRMVILNGFNYLIFRLPLAIIHFYGFFYRYDTDTKKHYPSLIGYIVCRRYKFCKNLAEIFYFLYLVSFLIQFIIFYKLDKNFRGSILSIKNKIKILFKNCKIS